MKRTHITCCLAILCLAGGAQAAREILLRNAPEAEAEARILPDPPKLGERRGAHPASAPSLRSSESEGGRIPHPAPLAIPAPRALVKADVPIAQTDPDSLPPENVIWQPPTRQADTTLAAAAAATTPTPRISNPDLMVTSEQTQARESAPDFGPAKAPRLLTGTLKQDLSNDGSAYPIRLRSPEGRFIAYVDFSSIYISDISPFLDQKVYLHGQVHPLPGYGGQLVILAEELRLAE